MILPSESQEQKALIVWWSFVHTSFGVPETVLFSIPNQAARSLRNGGRMKAEGTRAGIPDLFLAAPRKESHGLFLEMKRSDGGKLSEFQKQMIFDLGSQGYSTAVCHGCAAAKAVITQYLTP